MRPQRDDRGVPRATRACSARVPKKEDGVSIAATVEFRGVKIVSESALALCCRIMGRDHWIPPHRLLEGSSVARFGDRGTIIVARQFAEDNGLLLSPFPGFDRG